MRVLFNKQRELIVNIKSLLTAIACLVIVGCSTSGTFKLPENSQLYIYDRAEPVQVAEDGKVVTRPYFWSAAGGIPYRLEQEGKVIDEGKLRAKFRPVSIFWPPYALIYWPIGLNPNITYDLVNGTQE